MQMYYNVNSNTLYGRLFMELNNTIATPLYKQLEEKLQHEIETGERPAGSRLPTENELSETYHVSRVTVRKALAGLSELGYLDRKSGKGTFVAEKFLFLICGRDILIRISRPQIRKRNFCRRKEAPPQYNGSHQLY